MLHGYVEEVLSAIPRSKKILVGGREVTAISHGEDEVKWLLERGYDIPFPAEIYYKWPKIEGKFDPMPHQKYSVGFMSTHIRCHNLSQPRTGKTHSVLMTFDYLKQIGRVKKMIVYATKSTLETVWAQSIFESYPHLTYSVVYGTLARKQEQLAHDVDIYVCNHDAVKSLHKDILKRADIQMHAWDEADNLCNGQTDMWKKFNSVLVPDSRVILMSGTPTGEKPTDAWALAKLVAPNLVPKYFGAFKRDTMYQVSQFRWVPKSDAKDKVFAALQPAICFMKKDVLKDLPPISHERIQCELSEDQRRMFKELQKDMATEYKGGNLNAVNAADELSKCLQLLLGSYKTQEGIYQSVDFQPRLDTILNCIKSASKKILIFVPFKGALHAYHKELKKLYTCEVVDGDTSKDERARIFTSFQKDIDPHIVLAHPKTTAHGIEASAADTIIYAGPLYSGKQFMQSMERINSIKQDSPMMIYYIGASKLEWKRYDNMLGKKEHQDSVLEMYKAALDEKL